MQRKDAFRKLRVICQRLDELDPEQFFVAPLRLYLFGSLLTDKPNPSDADLLFEYRDRPDLDAGNIVYRMTYGKPLPHDQAVTHLRQGMKMIRIEFLDCSIEDWLREHLFLPDTPVRLVWEPGVDWGPIVDELEAHPIAWDPGFEKRNKELQETARQIAQDQGMLAAGEWLKNQA